MVNTHEHFDHVFGNGAFSGRAHPRARERSGRDPDVRRPGSRQLIAADRELDPEHPEITDEILQDVLDTEPVLPDRTFSSAATIDLGDRYVELLHLGRGHTDGDLVLRVPDCDVLFAGDLVEESADRDATPGFGTDCWPLEWADTLDLRDRAAAARSSLVVPGHGTVVGPGLRRAANATTSPTSPRSSEALAASGVPVDEALRAGEQAAATRPAVGGRRPGVRPDRRPAAGGTGWPFPSQYLDQAVRRGYAHLGISSRLRTCCPIVSPASGARPVS